MSIRQPIEAIARKPLHAELVERLQDMILTGALAPGTKFPEKELCEQFGVSRTPMREAMKVLAADNLVVLEQNRGAWVSRLTLEELEEVFPVMAALEALSGELACLHVTDEEIEEIQGLHDTMVEHYLARDLDGYFSANQQIHARILAAARNETLSAQYHSLALRARRARYVANMSPARWQQAVEEHEAIMTSLRARDGDGLGRILKRHIDNKFETVRDWLEGSD